MTKHVVGFSGGIDSQACALWVRNHFPAEDVILTNSQAGRNEHPVTCEFIERYSRLYFPVTEVVPVITDLGDVGTKDRGTGDRRREFAEDDELTFDRLAYVKGIFPSRKAQFCTEYLKLKPQQRWCFEELRDKGIDYVRYTGVRRDESEARKDVPDKEWDTYFDCELVRPIASWTKKECFDYVVAHGEDYNPLYKMGFSRVGCAPCINSGKDDIREWSARFPEMIDKVRAWEKSVGRAFFRPMIPNAAHRKAMKAWHREHCDAKVIRTKKGRKKVVYIPRPEAAPKPETPINWIDEVVAWAKTARGGRQTLLPMVEAEADAKTCSSKYGLCE